jgi:RNA polymerase sigma factor (sigma-70 family)
MKYSPTNSYARIANVTFGDAKRSRSMNVMTPDAEQRSPSPLLTDQDLVACCLAGETAAFAILVDRHRARLERLLGALLHYRAAREDVWQETLLRAYFNLDQLRDPARFGAWICSIAINQARTMRGANPYLTVSWEDLATEGRDSMVASMQSEPEAMLLQKEMVRRVRQAIADLPPAEREAVLLVYLDGFGHKEAAAQLGTSLSAVKVRVHRGRRRLQQALQGGYGQSLHHRAKERKMIPVTVHDVLMKTGQAAASTEPGATATTDTAVDPSHRMVLLKEETGERVLPIWIGPFEGDAIALYLKQLQTPRPLTFDLFKTLLTLGQIVVERVIVVRLHENCFYSNLVMKTAAGAAEVDCRPSDAINMALRLGVPIFVAEEAEVSLPFYEHVLDFLANGPSPQEIIDFRPSADVLSRFSEYYREEPRIARKARMIACSYPRIAVNPRFFIGIGQGIHTRGRTADSEKARMVACSYPRIAVNPRFFIRAE